MAAAAIRLHGAGEHPVQLLSRPVLRKVSVSWLQRFTEAQKVHLTCPTNTE